MRYNTKISFLLGNTETENVKQKRFISKKVLHDKSSLAELYRKWIFNKKPAREAETEISPAAPATAILLKLKAETNLQNLCSFAFLPPVN